MNASTPVLLTLVALWYGSSAACTTTSKQLLALLSPQHCALQLTSVQFGVAMLAAAVVSLCSGKMPLLPYCVWPLAGAIALSYTAGFVLLNLSLLYIHASLAETVRGLEPLCSAAIACALGVRGGRLSVRALLALVALVVGGTLSALSQPASERSEGFYLGLLLANGANLAFAFRGTLTTAAQDLLAAENERPLDANAIFLYQHAMGFAATVLLSVGAGGYPSRLVSGESREVVMLLASSASAFFAYNRLSLAVLLRLNAVSHSVCNALRRAVTVAAATLIFGNAVTLLSLTAIGLVVSGSGGYALAVAADKAAAARGKEARARISAYPSETEVEES